MKRDYSPVSMYRLPWNFTDNSISWLEPTSCCNLYCDGCYRENRQGSQKSLTQIEQELDTFAKYRKSDAISIAGGEPLTHTQIVDIVRIIAKHGWKPVINSNGALLTEDLLLRLNDAGVFGFTFHVDSGQNRPGFKGKNEIELNNERLRLAKMLVKAGDVSCSFNATIYPETLKYVPELTKWAQENIDIVQGMVFILYRMAIIDKDMDFYVGDKKVDFAVMYAKQEDNRGTDISSPEAVKEIRKAYPDFTPSAYLNGTHQPDTYKWLLTGRMGNKHQIFGYTGPKFMELVQNVKHFFTGSYLAYSKPSTTRKGRSFFVLSPIDRGIAGIAQNYFKSLFTNPKSFFRRVHYQSVMIIQPADVLPNGDINMCDGCPDITVWKDKLVWSCRMEEQMKWGDNVRAVPKMSDKLHTTKL